jgi:hypothetical protein
MSSLIGTDAPGVVERDRIERLGHSIRGKLQFMDYLLRAAIADVDRCLNEPDPGTRGFLRQLVEMHASNLAAEAESMRVVGDLARSIEQILDSGAEDAQGREDDPFSPLDADDEAALSGHPQEAHR